MQIQPILAALRRHRIAAFLIGMQIALACAILCNALFVISNRLDMMGVESGVDEDQLVVLWLEGIDETRALDVAARLQAGLAAVAGVESVALTNSAPFTQRAGEAGFRLKADDVHYNNQGHFYVGAPSFIDTMGLELASGRWFRPDEYGEMVDFVPESPSIMVDAVYAEQLWPGQDPLGKMIYVIDHGYRVIGTYRSLLRPDPSPHRKHNSLLLAGTPGPHFANVYILRTTPEQTGRVLRDALAVVAKLAPTVVVNKGNSGTMLKLRHTYFADDRAMAGIMLGVIASLLLVTALGIVGLASFWVAQRRKQIGVRRALGATRGDILAYFQTENLLIVSFGIELGMALAYGINLLLMQYYELPRLPYWYLPIGAVVLWLLGQIAVLGPALRAADVPPVVATRSV